MKSTLLILLLFLCKRFICFNDFPSLMTANATMVLVIEKTFYERKILAKEIAVVTRDAYDKSVASFASAITKMARERMNISGLSIHVLQDTGVNLARDYTILLSVATCSSTWALFERAKKEKLVHLAITDLDCPRLPIEDGVGIPLVDPGEELPQVFYDLRLTRGLDWNRAIMLYDETFERDSIGKVVRAFCNELPQSSLGLSSTSLFHIRRGSSEASTKKIIHNILSSLPPRRPKDDHFIVVAAHSTIPLILENARLLGMLHPQSHWLFVVPDMSEFAKGNVTYLIELLEEGENIAFLYNNTNLDIRTNQSCRTGAICHAREMIGALGIALEKSLSKEIELYERVTEEEFEEAGLTKAVRSRHIITYLRDELYNDSKPGFGRGSTCGRCIKWNVASALTWGNKIGTKAKIEPHTLMETGVWTPDPGYESKEYIFPHAIHGFRGKELPIVTYHGDDIYVIYIEHSIRMKIACRSIRKAVRNFFPESTFLRNIRDTIYTEKKIVNPPWQFELTKTDELTKSTTTEWSGLVFDVFNELSKKLNFTYKTIVVESPPEIMMAKSNPTKASMSASEKIPEKVTEFVRAKSVFMAVCAYTVGIHRKEASINFTLPLTIQTYGLLAPKPKPLSRALLFASPYSNEAWALLASSILAVGPILYAVHKFSPRRNELTKDSREPIYIGLSSPSKCIWYIYGALLQQGGMNLPKTDGARLIVGTWWLVVMVVVATYSGSLVAFLTFPKMEPPIDDVNDILQRRKEFTWSIPVGSFLEDFLIVGNEDGVIDYRRLIADNEPNAQKHDAVGYEMNIQKVKTGKHAVIDWTSSLKISIRNDHIASGYCSFSLGKDVLMLEEPISMVVPADSPYLRIINIQLRKMYESGLINKWIADRLPIRDSCSISLLGSSLEAINHKVDLEDMQGIFFVLLFGYFIGTIILGYEFWRNHRRIKKESKLIHPFLE